MNRSFVLQVENVNPRHAPIVRHLSGDLKTVARNAAASVRYLAEAFGVSPMSLNWQCKEVA